MKKILLYLFIILSINACREDAIVTNTVIDEPIPGESFVYEFGIYGLVVNENNEPIQVASVVADGVTKMTDENGYFEFEDLLSTSDGLYVSARSTGYIDGGVLVFPNDDNTQQIKIVLIADSGSNIISNSEGGVLDLQDGSQVIIPANSFDLQEEIQVQAHFIPSSKVNFTEVYPSGFIGIDKDEDLKHLESIGAVVVEFTDEQGNEVKLKEGVDVTLRLPIPDGDWPTTISLWSLNDNTGYWIEESTAVKVGDFYEGTVNHFSWWCASDPQDAIDVCFDVKTPEGQAASSLQYFVLSWSYSNPFFANGITDIDGGFCIKVPEGEELAVVILDDCGVDLYEETLTITSGNTDREIIINSLPSETIFSGTITRCDGSEVQDGYLSMKIGSNQVLVSIDGGAYSYTNYCSFDESDEIEVLAVDKSDLSSSSFSIANVSGQQNYVNDITLCEQLETFMNFKNEATGDEFVLTNCEALKNPTETLIVGTDPTNSSESILLGIEGFTEGTFGTSLFGPDNSTALPATFSATITKYQGVGGYIEGTFTGNNDNGEAILGQFRAERTK